jgi:hypothetical protein
MGYQDSAQHSITMVPQNQTATIKGEKGGKQDGVVIVSVGSRRSERGLWCVVRGQKRGVVVIPTVMPVACIGGNKRRFGIEAHYTRRQRHAAGYRLLRRVRSCYSWCRV